MMEPIPQEAHITVPQKQSVLDDDSDHERVDNEGGADDDESEEEEDDDDDEEQETEDERQQRLEAARQAAREKEHKKKQPKKNDLDDLDDILNEFGIDASANQPQQQEPTEAAPLTTPINPQRKSRGDQKSQTQTRRSLTPLITLFP
jgi:hypothetical protein